MPATMPSSSAWGTRCRARRDSTADMPLSPRSRDRVRAPVLACKWNSKPIPSSRPRARLPAARTPGWTAASNTTWFTPCRVCATTLLAACSSTRRRMPESRAGAAVTAEEAEAMAGTRGAGERSGWRRGARKAGVCRAREATVSMMHLYMYGTVTFTIFVTTMSATHSKTGIAPPLVHVERIIEKIISRDDAGKSLSFVGVDDSVPVGSMVYVSAGHSSCECA
mmetsp:Transcript_11215/g.24055  ORF Transcript_11215/g.24055 Transcript_11215/m.24055 type:complete len:223 (+) Transcript_11215:609-1277(+)